jgi:hypothetical protein
MHSEAWPSNLAAFGTRDGESRLGAFRQPDAFLLGEGCNDADNRFLEDAAGIEVRFRERAKSDAV